MRPAISLDHLIGIPYCANTFDCADLVILVQRELFGREVQLPATRPRGKPGAPRMRRYSRQLACLTATPADGDLVLMCEFGQKRPGHAGVYFFLDHDAWVLHTAASTGGSVLHRLRELPDFGIRVEGVYTWNGSNGITD